MRRIGDAPAVRRLLIGAALLLSALFLLLPLVAIFAQAFSQGVMVFWANVSDTFTLHAIGLTLVIALLTIPICRIWCRLGVAGYPLQFPGCASQCLYPYSICRFPRSCRAIYLLLYGRNGWIGSWRNTHDIQLMFAWPGILMVTILVSPFVARELIPLMQAQGSREEEAAVTLGAGGWTTFRRVTLPNIRWALLYGIILTNARAVGEFGAVSVVAGAIQERPTPYCCISSFIRITTRWARLLAPRYWPLLPC